MFGELGLPLLDSPYKNLAMDHQAALDGLLWMDETMALPSASTIRQLVVKSVAVGSHQTAVAGSKDGIR